MDELTPEQLEYVIQFRHPEKMLVGMAGINERNVAALFDIDVAAYQRIKGQFGARAYRAAADLLADPEFATRVDRLPFEPGQTVVGLGDSITDDYQSWIEILRHLLAIRRPKDEINVVNAGISGDTTSQMISRFLDVVLQGPDWIVCMAGTNDARRHGLSPTKILVSAEETEKNLAMLRNFAATQTSAQWVWMTPATVIPDLIAAHWFLGPFQMMWLNEDLSAIAEAMRRQTEPVLDLQAVFGVPADPKLLLSDGLHPSLAGQKAIVQALVETLSSS